MFLLIKLVSIKQSDDPESIKVGNRLSGETEGLGETEADGETDSEGENRSGWETEVPESGNRLEPGAYSLEEENRPSLEPGETEEGNNDTGTDPQ